MDIDESLAQARVMDRDGYPYIIHPLLDGVPRVDPALLQQFTAWAEELPFVQDATLLMAPEAMGIPVGVALSLQTGKPYVVVRKRRYDLEGEEVAYCETGYGQNCLYVNDVRPGDRVAIIDDVISTGGTLDGILHTLTGMDVQITGVAAFLDKSGKGEALAARHGVPVQAMRRVHVERGQVTIEEA